MALVRFETNASISEDRARIIRQNLTKAVSRFTGESDRDVQVEIAGDRRMRMAADDGRLAHVEIRNVEIDKGRAPELTQAICPVVNEALAIPDENIYIAVISTRNSMWRVNGDTR